VEKQLRARGYQTERVAPGSGKAGKAGEIENPLCLLRVEGAILVSDNLEADPGQNYNVTGDLNAVSFEQVLEVGLLVRQEVEVARVICFGNPLVGIDRLLSLVEEKEGRLCGVSSTRSGAYGEGYRCVHLGRGANPSQQVPALLAEQGVPVVLLGKVADVVENKQGKSVSGVDLEEALALTLETFETLDQGFICVNVQATDLAGHMRNPLQYAEALKRSDPWIGRLTERLRDDDLLVVMADHGNDPCIGHSRHTREKVPILAHSPKFEKKLPRNSLCLLGERPTLSDVGITVTSHFGARPPENQGACPLDPLAFGGPFTPRLR
jgi:phosphopentomutase